MHRSVVFYLLFLPNSWDGIWCSDSDLLNLFITGITVLFSLYDNHLLHPAGGFPLSQRKRKKINMKDLCLNKVRISHERPQEMFKVCSFGFFSQSESRWLPWLALWNTEAGTLICLFCFFLQMGPRSRFCWPWRKFPQPHRGAGWDFSFWLSSEQGREGKVPKWTGCLLEPGQWVVSSQGTAWKTKFLSFCGICDVFFPNLWPGVQTPMWYFYVCGVRTGAILPEEGDVCVQWLSWAKSRDHCGQEKKYPWLDCLQVNHGNILKALNSIYLSFFLLLLFY